MTKRSRDVLKEYETSAPTYNETISSQLRKFAGISHEEVVSAILSACIPLRGGFVLDLGAGTGILTEALSKTYNGFIVGLDLSQPMLKRAKHRLAGRCGLVLGSTDQLPFKDSCVDLVTSSLVLRHTNIDKTLYEVNRVLRRKGKFVFSDFISTDTWKSPRGRIAVPVLLALCSLDPRLCAERKASFLSLDDWKVLLERFGFEDVLVERTDQKRDGVYPALMLAAATKK